MFVNWALCWDKNFIAHNLWSLDNKDAFLGMNLFGRILYRVWNSYYQMVSTRMHRLRWYQFMYVCKNLCQFILNLTNTNTPYLCEISITKSLSESVGI